MVAAIVCVADVLQGSVRMSEEEKKAEDGKEGPPSLVVTTSEETSQTISPPASPASEEHRQVHVAPNLMDLVTGLLATPEEIQQAKTRRDLNEVVHNLLIVGLIISTVLMLTGLGLDFALGREVPNSIPNLGEILGRIAALRPSGFLSLGLLVLIATPIFRVVSSIIVFIYERDWRYMIVTMIVFAVVLFSVIFGSG
jgi:uncharacterized membrane protein